MPAALRRLIDRYRTWRSAPATRSSHVEEPEKMRIDADPEMLGRAMGAGEGGGVGSG